MAVKLLMPFPAAEALSDLSPMGSGAKGALAELDREEGRLSPRIAGRMQPHALGRADGRWSIAVAALRLERIDGSDQERIGQLEAIAARNAALRTQIEGLETELQRLSSERRAIRTALQQMLAVRERELSAWRSRETVLLRDLELTRRNLSVARSQLAEARLALKTERLAWVRERRQLEGRAALLQKEAERSWWSRLLHGKPAL